MSEIDRLARDIKEEAKAVLKKLPWWAELLLGLEVAAAIALAVLECVASLGLGCLLAVIALAAMILISVYVYLDEGSEKDALKVKLRRAKALTASAGESQAGEAQ